MVVVIVVVVERVVIVWIFSCLCVDFARSVSMTANITKESKMID